MTTFVTLCGGCIPHPYLNRLSPGTPSQPNIPSNPSPRRMKLINVHMLSTSEQVEKANVLLTEARQHLEEYESSIGQDNHMMAEGLLAM